MQQKEVEIFYPANRAAWRKWLETNHLSSQAVWLIFYTKKSGKSTITWAEAVEEALCYGWIDSKKVKIDEEKAHQFFSKRKPKSTWSKINKAKVQQLIADGRMTAAGLQIIETAQQNGSWNLLDSVEELVIPEDLEAAFATHPTAKDFFLRLSKSARKVLLQGLVLAKRPETRQKRITEIVDLANQKQKPRP
ncbi:YdeI/OmpD-associated family protein [Rufibacter roseus]|uniref:YdeI family protein n=1 Tax=Rufibacter roseus TaxID=1567108 RepID=A0ABW2DGY5_9BACT|nr:YdeI/OmpD-associated family protein [Rufibacter roseus]